MPSHRLLLLVALFHGALTGAPALAQANPSCQVQPKMLAAMRNCYRPLLVFSPTAGDARLKKQSELLDQDADDMMDRFVLFTPIVPSAKDFTPPLDTPYVVLTSRQMQAIRSQFQVPADTFLVLLLGEDLGEKLRSPRPIDPMRLNALIDHMPTRKQEMQRPHAN
jgi:Domain of unknown function (DUF4174)